MTVCITTVVDGEFQRYTPLFILSVLTAYPDYSVRVFVRDEPSDELKDGLELLDTIEGLGDWQVITGELGGYKYCKRLGAFLRFLLFTRERAERYFSDFDYVYITDGDLLITRETPPLHAQHTEHMRVTGLPYSDILRYGEPNVITGLLFASQEFVQRIAPTVEWYDAEFRERADNVLDIARRIPDERLLYQIIRDSGIGLPPQHQLEDDPLQERLSDPANYRDLVFRPWHGLNTGAGFAKPHRNMIRLDLPYRMESARQIATMIATSMGAACMELLNDGQRKALMRCIGSKPDPYVSRRFDSELTAGIVKARRDFLSRLHLPLNGRRLLEAGAGVGLMTSAFENAGATVTAAEGRQCNIDENIRRHPGREGRVILADLDEPGEHASLGKFDAVICMGVLYHLRDPGACIAEMAGICLDWMMVETRVNQTDNGQINEHKEPDGADQSLHGRGCTPGRDWVVAELRKHFPFVYTTTAQPDHEWFPDKWPTDCVSCRAIFVASRRQMHNALLRNA